MPPLKDSLIFRVLVVYFIMNALTVKSQVPEKASPFTAVRWEAERPVVRWEGDWYHFHSINGITVDAIIDFSKKNYESRWQKRFSEDFVEVLTNMGYEIDKNVNLILIQSGTRYSKVGTMTKENRNMVRDFNNGQDAMSTTETKDKSNPQVLTSNSSQQALANQMAEWIDKVWEENPPENAAHLRFIFYKDGKKFPGKIDIHCDFVFRAKSRTNHVQAFNPNSNGRWIFEEIPPGTYDLSITGKNQFADWSWTQAGVKVSPNTNPVFTINLE